MVIGDWWFRGLGALTLFRPTVRIASPKKCFNVLDSIWFHYYIHSLDFSISIIYSTTIASPHDSLVAILSDQ
jgi:hypothetical protein